MFLLTNNVKFTFAFISHSVYHRTISLILFHQLPVTRPLTTCERVTYKTALFSLLSDFSFVVIMKYI